MNIVFIGATGNYPLEISASNSKNELISKGLISAGCKVTIINSPIGSSQINSEQLDSTEFGIRYIVFPKKKILKNFKRIWDNIKILKSDTNENIAILSLSYGRLPLLFYYIVIAKLQKYKLVLIINEWRIPPKRRGITFFKIVKDLHELLKINMIPPACDMILPISTFIDKKISKYNKVSLVLPALADIGKIVPLKNENIDNSFLYCGIGYFDVAMMVLKAFNQISKNSKTNLTLVIGFKNDKNNKFKNQILHYIEVNGIKKKVKLLSNISYDRLIALYQTSLALLIPLNENNLQDQSRFPNKIGEYASAGRPIITMNVGDVGVYFDDKSIYYVNKYNVDELAITMNKVARNISHANKVGQNGRIVAEKVLNSELYGKKLYNLFSTLSKK